MGLWSWFAGSCTFISLLWLSFITILSRVWEAMGWTGRERKFLFFYIDFMIDRIFHRDRLVFVSLFLLLFLRFLSSVSLSLSLSSLRAAGLVFWVAVSSQAQRARQTVRLLPVSSRHRWRTQSPPLHGFAARRPRALGGEIINHSSVHHPHCNSLSARCGYNAAMDTQMAV